MSQPPWDSTPTPPADTTITQVSKDVDAARQVVADVGLRPYRVFTVVERWSGVRTGEGEVESRTFTEITPPPRVKPIQPWQMTAAGYQLEGTLIVDRISRTKYRLEELKGQTLYGDRMPKNQRFFWGLLATGHDLVELYSMKGEPTLENFGWRAALVPTNHRVPLVL